MKEKTLNNIIIGFTIFIGIVYLAVTIINFNSKPDSTEIENARLKQEIAKCNTVIDSLSNILDNNDSALVWFYKPDLKKELK